MQPKKKSIEKNIITTGFEEIYFRVVSFPSSLKNDNRFKGRNSRGHQHHVKDSLISISSMEGSSRINRDVRRPSAPAWNTIHLRGGVLRSIPAFSTFPPPLNTPVSTLSPFKKNALTYLSAFLRTRLPLYVGDFGLTFLITSQWIPWSLHCSWRAEHRHRLRIHDERHPLGL